MESNITKGFDFNFSHRGITKLYYTVCDGDVWIPVIVYADIDRIIRVCRNRRNWVNKKGTSDARVGLVGLKVQKYSQDLERFIDTQLFVFFGLRFPDGRIWDSYFRGFRKDF